MVRQAYNLSSIAPQTTAALEYLYRQQLSSSYKVIQLMKNQEFQVKLLVKQNTEMAIKLQTYRRENQELNQKNNNLNCWVQNLSEVFSSIAAAWKIITDNQQALYTLMRRKSDVNSKQLVGKYISHFKTFEEIIVNLGDKITNEGHSNSATTDAKDRINSFLNNYNLFFFQFVETFFKFNEDCLAMANDKLKDPNMPAQMRQIATQSIENRQKIKEFEEYIHKMSQNLKLYQSHNQHVLLDGVIMQKNKQIEELKNITQKQARRIAYMTDYNTDNINFVLQKQENFMCSCGGAPLAYYNKIWEQNLKNQSNTLAKKQSSQQMMDESEQGIKEKIKQLGELEIEKQLLMQRNVQVLAKCEKIKLQNKISDEIILQSPIYLHLRKQFKDLMDYSNGLTLRLNKNYEYLHEIQKIRQEQIEELKKKYEKNSASQLRHRSEHTPLGPDYTFLNKFKEKIESYCLDIKNKYTSISKGINDKEEVLTQTKQSLRTVKKQNEDLNRRLSELQEKQLKSIETMEFRHQKFNQLQKSMHELFKTYPNRSEELDKTKKLWEQFTQYTKTRDKKIKAMEDVIKKKQREIVQKQKVEEVLKSAMKDTEDIYQKYKQKLTSFEDFMKNMEKEILSLSEQNYKIKMEFQQEKNLLSIRLKNELEVKSKLQEKAKSCEKIEEEVKTIKLLSIELQKKIQEQQTTEKQKNSSLQLELKEKERIIQQLNDTLNEKEKNIEKLIEDKEKKNMEYNKLQLKMSSNSEFDVLRMELEEYKSKIMCRCGAEREREVVLKTCPHIFCKKCIDDTTANRNRKCPICGVRFTKTDIHQINWT